MQLLLAVHPPEGGPLDVSVDVAHECPTTQLVEELARHAGVGGAQTAAYCRRLELWLDGATPVGSSGLRSGDRLYLSPSGPTPVEGRSRPSPQEAPFELRVVGGELSGFRVALTPGEHLVGRSGRTTVRLDDPSMSREHVRLTVSAEQVEAEDAGSSNGTFLEGEPVIAPTRLGPGGILRAGRTLLAVTPAREDSEPAEAPTDGEVRFNRPPRVAPRLVPRTLEAPAPPDEAHRPRLPFAASLVPLAGGLVLYSLTRNPISLVFAGLTPVMAVWTFLEDRRRGRKTFGKRAARFERGLDELESTLAAARGEEIEARRRSSPDAGELLERARLCLPALWERRPGDDDFLHLRLGTADLPSLTEVALPSRGEEEVLAEIEARVARFATVPCVPVTVPLLEQGPLGLSGPRERVDALARWLLLQAAVLHSPRDVLVAAAVPHERLAEWDWLKWLPHVRPGGSPAAAGTLSADAASTRELFAALGALLDERRSDARARVGRTATPLPVVLLLVDGEVVPDRALVGDLLAEGAEHGIGVVWLAEDARALPGECRALAELEPEVARLRLTKTETGQVVEDVTADGVTAAIAREGALALAPVVDVGTTAAAGRLPRRVSLLDLLGAADADSRFVAERWRGFDGRRAAPLGVSADGTLEVDLVRDGPHTLVGGTTGAGKSELLQTLVASLAATAPPTRLSFLLVDYKGGAAFKDCVTLPHTVGFVTDLDEHLTRRARVSLNAELRRRETLLRAAGAKDLADMERRDPSGAPASLVIVVDEFATLVKEIPEFVDAVVDVAQRGRTLGLHLVLATQRPRGAITENVRANTNLRIAMRVADAAESEDVIGAPDAARIPRSLPGRAFVRTGHGELAELQAAFVGGPAGSRDEGPAVVVSRLAFGDHGHAAGDGSAEASGGRSELEVLVQAIGGAADALQIDRPPSPWLPPLPELVALGALEGDVSGEVAALGLVDEPAAQSQRPLTFDPEQEGSLLVYGTTGSGKTAVLRTLAVSLARRLPPEELHLYGLDFATRGLEPLRSLPHCGGIVPGEDEELVARAFALLRRTIAERKDAVARTGAASLSELRRAGVAFPRVFVLLDGYSAFVAAHDRVNAGELVEALPRVVADGRALGVHFAISADRRGAVRSALAGSVETRIVLRMADEDEYAALGVDARAVRGAALPPGRGFVDGDLEVQCALVGDDPARESDAVSEAGAELAARHTARAPALARLPAEVRRDSLPPPSKPLEAVLGLSDELLSPVAIRLDDGFFLVAGPRRSGRTTALATLAASLRASSKELPLHLAVPRRSSLPELPVWTTVARGHDEAETFFSGLAETVAARTAGADPLVVVVDDGTELTDGRAAAALEAIARRGRDVNLWLVAAVEANAAHRTFGGWIREVRNEEHGLLLVPQLDVDGDLLGVRLPRGATRAFPPGRGFLVRRGSLELVQVAG